MIVKPELQYSKSHEWVRMDGDVAVVGISDFAQDALGDLVFVNLPQVGDDVTAGEPFGDVESVKAVSDLISPVTGTVCEINEQGRIVASAITDFEGKFTLKVVNTQDELRFSYVGCQTVKLAIDGIKYDVRLQPVEMTAPDIIRKRQVGY